ncbi:MAG TPA: DUF3800 domain-containing protein [Vicinamibacterales bacterium]|nr:DUF3800 domain-containing protein [Vicinamibacterales bacterium]
MIAYFDESGTHAGATVLSVGGYMAPAEGWAAFDVEWQQALSDYAIEYFRMADFENRQGQFRNWPTNRRVHRLSRLLTIINRHTTASAGMSVDRVAYERIFPDALKEKVRGPYGLALKGCLASLKRLSKRVKWTDAIQVVFDFGADEAGTIEQETLRVINDNPDESRYLDVRFERKRHVSRLQAADIAAYDMCKEVARVLGHHGRKQRKLMERFRERYLYWNYMDEEELTRFVERNAHLV